MERDSGHPFRGCQRRFQVDLARLLIGDWDVLMLDRPPTTWTCRHPLARQAPEDPLAPRGQGALLVVTHDRWFPRRVCRALGECTAAVSGTLRGGFFRLHRGVGRRDRLEALAKGRSARTPLRRELAWLSRGSRARAT